MLLRINRVRINRYFKTWNDRNLAKYLQQLRIKWNFELTVFELTVPDLYLISGCHVTGMLLFLVYVAYVRVWKLKLFPCYVKPWAHWTLPSQRAQSEISRSEEFHFGNSFQNSKMTMKIQRPDPTQPNPKTPNWPNPTWSDPIQSNPDWPYQTQINPTQPNLIHPIQPSSNRRSHPPKHKFSVFPSFPNFLMFCLIKFCVGWIYLFRIKLSFCALHGKNSPKINEKPALNQ